MHDADDEGEEDQRRPDVGEPEDGGADEPGKPLWVSAPTVLVCTLVLAAEIPLNTPGRSPTAVDWAAGTLGVVALWLVGVLVRLARRHRRARRPERAAGRSRARLTDERLSIARELHDLVAHHASAVAVQASAARSNPAALPDAVTHIEEGGLRIAEAVRGWPTSPRPRDRPRR